MTGYWQIAAFAALSAALIGGSGLLFYLLRRMGHAGVDTATPPEEQPAAGAQQRQAMDYVSMLCLVPLVAYLLLWSLIARRLPVIGVVSGLVLGLVTIVVVLCVSVHPTARR